jgi:hypothetical protein
MFVFIAGAMAIVMVATGTVGAKARDVALRANSKRGWSVMPALRRAALLF